MQGDACPKKSSNRSHSHGDLIKGPVPMSQVRLSAGGNLPPTPGHKQNCRGHDHDRASSRPRGYCHLYNWNPGCLTAKSMFSISTRYQILAQILVDTGRKEGIKEDAVGLTDSDRMEAKAQPRAGWSRVSPSKPSK